MNDIKFNCPHCDQSLAVDVAGAGETVACPQCGQAVSVPQLARLAQAPPSAKTPSRGRGWGLAVLGLVALSLLVAGLLLWQRHGFYFQKIVPYTGNGPAVPQIAPSIGSATNGTVTANVNATGDTSARAVLTVVTNFEGASARVLALDQDSQTIRITPAGSPERGWPCWWYLRLDGIDVSRTLILQVQANTSEITSQGGSAHKMLGAQFSLPNQAAISTNGVDWEQTPFGKRHGNEISYDIQPEASNLWLAWGPPFTLSDASRFVRDAARDHSFAKSFTLASSLENRPVPALQVSERDLPESRRPAIWVIARQHAWEVGSSWVDVGFAKWLLSDDPTAKRLRSQDEIFVVPVMDGDRMATGDGGKQSIPHDHNEDWSDTPHYPEVAAVEQRISTLVKENRMALVVDVHDPGSGPRPQCQLWVTPTNFLSAAKTQNQERFIQAANQDIRSPMTMTQNVHWDGPGDSEYWQTAWHYLTCPWIYEHSNPQTVAVTLEVPWNATTSTISGYGSVGEGLGRAIERYMSETPWPGTAARSSAPPP